jgi:hypothetical protein
MTVHTYAGNGPANLVSNAIPFKPGVVNDARNVRILDGMVEVPVAIQVLGRWPNDSSIRSLLVQFNAPMVTATKQYTLEVGLARRTVDASIIPVSWDVPQRVFTLPPTYLSDSLIAWEQKPLGQPGFAAWDQKQLQYYGRIENPGISNCARNDQYYDAITTTYQLYVRTGDVKYLINARRWALHHRRDQIYLTGANIGHPQCTGGYLNNTRYTFPQGLVQDYFMFGDEEDKRVSTLVVDNFYMNSSWNWWWYKAPNTRGFWTEREPAFALIGVLAQYEATNDVRYLNFAREKITLLHRMQTENGRRAWVHNLYDHDPAEGCSATTYGSSPWMSGLLLEAVVKYHKLTADSTAREAIVMAVDDLSARYVATSGSFAGRSFIYLGCTSAYNEGTPDLDNLISHAYGYAWKLTGNNAYRTIGQALFNTAVADGYAGAHKQYDQQFRSSGHFVAYVSSPPPGTDTTAPTVSLTSPATAQTVSGTIVLAASATDNVGIAGVQFLLDGQAYGAEDTTDPYSISMNSSTLPNGSHTLAARARDAAGNVRTSGTVTVTISNADTSAPSVAVISPVAGQVVSGNISVGVNASDNVGIAGVQLLFDGQTYGPEDTSAPYTLSMNSSAWANGNHTLAARARDAAGNVRTSAAITFRVNNVTNVDTIPPTVSVTSPAMAQMVSGAITGIVNASDNVGVVGVQFLLDGGVYGTEDTSAPYTVNLNTSTVPNGSHTLAALARDAAGNVRTCTAVTFTINNSSSIDTVAPTVSVTSPVTGQMVSSTLIASANAADNVGVAGVQFLVDGQAYGDEDTSMPYSISVLAMGLTNGSHTVVARARDMAGNVSTSAVAAFNVNRAITPNTLSIPTTHPRLWWTPERLKQARAWYAAHPFTPRADDYVGQAFRYVITGEASYARAAITRAMSITVDPTRTSGANEIRWSGEQVIFTYDWCYDQMTEQERKTLVDRWNGYLEVGRQQAWGGPNMPQNNYFWGYLRTNFEWGVATYHENPSAQVFLDDALGTRWSAFVQHSTANGRGGAAQEGTQYGPYLLNYATVPMMTGALQGRNLFEETNFFKEAVFHLIYATPPGQTIARSDNKPHWDVFPNNDDHGYLWGGSAQYRDLGDFMTTAAGYWKDLPVGQYARRWLKTVRPAVSPFVAATDTVGTERDLSSLPLDYYAPGPGWFYGRTAWGSQATAVNVILGSRSGVGGHIHDDQGQWQMWRNGRWLSREAAGYSDSVAAYRGTGTVPVFKAPAHNVILVNGAGMADGDQNGPPVVRRLESRREYSYAAVDLTPAYRNNLLRYPRAERDNAAVGHIEREFVFLRGLETLVVFDRVQSSEQAGTGTTKTFLAHFEQPPTADGPNSHVAVNGDQALRLTTLLPARASYRVVAEGGRVGLNRLEIDTSGETLSYFLTVLQARDANGQNLTSQLTETATSYVVTLQHPTRGNVRLEFNKGAASTGGGVAYSLASMPTSINPFIGTVQTIEVGSSGPVWGGSATGQ